MKALRSSSSPDTSLLAEIRDPALNFCLRLAAIGGPLLLFVVNAPNPDFKPMHPVMLAIFTIQAAVIVAAIWRKGPVGFRVGVLALFAALLGSAAMAYAGPSDGVSFLLLLCVLMAGLLYGRQAMAVVFLVVVGMFVVIGYLWVKGVLPPHETYVPLQPYESAFWVKSTVTFVLCGGIICGVAYYLVARLIRFYSEERRMLNSLGQEQQLRASAELHKLQAELQQRETEMEFASIMHAAPVGICLIRDRTIIRVNEQMSVLFGYRPAELVGQGSRVLYPTEEEYIQIGGDIYERIRRDGRASVEVTSRRKDGRLFASLVTAAPFDPARPEKGIIATIADVSAQHESQLALRDNEARLREILDHTKEVIFVVRVEPGPRFIYQQINRVAESMGIKMDDYCCGLKGPRDIFQPDDAVRLEAEYQSCLAARTTVIVEQTLDMPGGVGTRHFTTTLVPVFAPDNVQIIRLIGFAHDVTESRRAAELHTAKVEADAANRAKTVFLANMSHEIRTPLNSILGFAQLLARDAALTPTQREQLAIIGRNGDHLLSLINDILEISKIEANRSSLRLTVFNPAEQMQEVVAAFRPRFESKGVGFHVVIDPELPQGIEADAGKLRQILINLLGNALKFTFKGMVQVVAQSGEEQGGFIALRFEVHDTGTGIAPEEVSGLFRNFEQTEQGRRAGGTGLGLAISRHYARMMGGDLTVDSQVGVGSVFGFTIHVRVVESSRLVAPRSHRQIIGLAGGNRAPRILIVDDVADNRKLLVSLLQKIGFDTREAVDGADAVATSAQWMPDCILMDMRMPVLDGDGAIRQIQERQGPERPKIISLSASVFTNDEEGFRAAGADDFLAKPFQETVLLEKIGQLLGVTYRWAGEPVVAAGPAEAPDQVRLAEPVRIGLLAAAEEADMERILSLLSQLEPADHPFITELRQAASRYDYDRLRDCLTASAS